jgi:hypothetical protein
MEVQGIRTPFLTTISHLVNTHSTSCPNCVQTFSQSIRFPFFLKAHSIPIIMMLLYNIKNIELGTSQTLLLAILLCNAAVNAVPSATGTGGVARRDTPAEQACAEGDLNACNVAGAEGPDTSIFRRETPAIAELGEGPDTSISKKRETPAEAACAEGDVNACNQAGAEGPDTSIFKKRETPAEAACAEGDLNACNQAGAEGPDTSIFKKRETPAEAACAEGDLNACNQAGGEGPDTSIFKKRETPAEAACAEGDLNACNQAGAEGPDTSIFRRKLMVRRPFRA